MNKWRAFGATKTEGVAKSPIFEPDNTCDVSKRVYFISDLHLGSATFEHPLEVERRVVRFLRSIKDDCSALYLMGDVLDYWFEYRYVVPRGFTRFLGTLAELSDAGVEIHWFTGNHDIWIFDYLPSEVGATIHRTGEEAVICGRRFYLAHGDGLGDDSRAYRAMARFFRNRACQRMFSWIHPDLATAFARRWSRHSRLSGDEFPDFLGEDREHLVKFAKGYLASRPDVDYFVFGHRHIMLDLMLSARSRIVILGDWIRHYSYAVLGDDGELQLCQFEHDETPGGDDCRAGVSIAF